MARKAVPNYWPPVMSGEPEPQPYSQYPQWLASEPAVRATRPPARQLALPSSTPMWSSPMDANYGFYRSRFDGHHCHYNPHACLCGLRGSQCPPNYYNWLPHSQPPACRHCTVNQCESGIKRSDANEEGIDEADNRSLTGDEMDERSFLSQESERPVVTAAEEEDESVVSDLRGENELLRLNLEQTSEQLRHAKREAYKKAAHEYIDRYRRELERDLDFIKVETTRFGQNAAILAKLNALINDVNECRKCAIEAEERVRCGGCAAEKTLTDDDSDVKDVMLFEYKSLPEPPNMLDFYKSVLNEIPLIYLNDLSQLKQNASKYIEAKKSMPFENGYNGFAFGSANLLPPTTYDANSLFVSTDAKFNLDAISNAKESPSAVIGLPSFGNSDSNTAPMLASTPKLIDQPLNREIIAEILPTYSHLNSDNCKENVAPIAVPVVEKPISIAAKISDRQVTGGDRKPSPQPSLSASRDVNANSNAPLKSISQGQMKLIAKLKKKYEHLSDDELVASIARTKKALISSGQPNGFAGMIISDIVAKVSDDIEANIKSRTMLANVYWPQLGD